MSDEPASDGAIFNVNYIKSSGYREVHCDGLMGHPMSPNKLWISFFSERFPIPRVVGFKSQVEENRVQIDETQPPVYVESRQGLIRNMEFGVYLDLQVAEKIHAWLGSQIEQMRKSAV